MKNNTKKATTPTIEASTITLTIEGVTKHLSVYKETAPHELAIINCQADSARRNASLDLKEATANLELRKLRSGPPSDSTKQIESDLNGEIEEIAAMRSLGRIFDSIALAADELAAADLLAKPHSDRLAEMNGNAAALKSKLEDFQSRDIREELAVFEALENEMGWLRDLFERGSWKTTALDFRNALFEEELLTLRNQGRYHGELTREAAELRILFLETKISDLNARLESQLSSDEMSEMPRLMSEIGSIETAILEETRYSHFVVTTARFQERRFSDLLEAARISAENIVEIHQLSCEMRSLGTPWV